MLPELERARRLCQCYLQFGAWAFHPVDQEQVYENTLPLVYGYTGDVDREERALEVSPHKLALLFAVFSLGALLDPTLLPFNVRSLLEQLCEFSHSSSQEEANRWFHIAQIALGQRSMFDSGELETVQALALLSLFHGNSARYTMSSTWTFIAIAAKIAHGVWSSLLPKNLIKFGFFQMGMHRDIGDPQLDYAVIQRRRLLFWEVVGKCLIFCNSAQIVFIPAFRDRYFLLDRFGTVRNVIKRLLKGSLTFMNTILKTSVNPCIIHRLPFPRRPRANTGR